MIVVIALFLPLAGFLTLMLSSNMISRKAAGTIACATVLASFICFTTLLISHFYTDSTPQNIELFHWISVDRINADFNLLVDPLSLLMALIITGVGFLIHVYSNGYMDHEEDFARYFAFLNLFVFAMLLLVLAGNLLLVFVGWEGVGLASYLLIGFWYSRPTAAAAATKAFVVNRIGDLGFLLALLLTFHLFGTTDIQQIIQQATAQFSSGAPILIVLTALLFIGAAGKSAQLPLHIWLPDAMEGPTPVSALIHAATMVTAGVYLIVRLHPIFILAPQTLHVIGAIGGITALFASLCALGQTDLKRVLAYSTVSQLGLMFLACGVGAFYAAMFHLTTHAFIKGLLFLSAGNIVHMMHGTTDMGQMGGLSKKFPITRWLFLIGVLALSGIPPLAAFFSKDLILEQEYLAGFETLFYIALTASILTGVYLTRAYCLTFTGKPRLDERKFNEIHEAPKVMVIPVSILAFLSVFGGLLGFAFGKTPILESFLAEVGVTLANKPQTPFLLTPETLLSVAGAVLGVCMSALVYTVFVNKLGSPLTILRKSFFIDELYQALFVNPLEKISRLISKVIEPDVFGEAIVLIGKNTQKAAKKLQNIQSGQVRSYAAWMALGAVFIMAYLVFI